MREAIVLQARTAHNPFARKGTQEEWRDSVGTLAQGNSRLMLALCAAFAPPLLHPCGLESGGFNFVGASSTGKTTALLAASSVWGRGSREGGYMSAWRSTSNGLESLAALHNDALLVLDEIGQAPAQTVSEAAYLLANGTGKNRSRADGTAREALSWLLFVLSSGETGLAERIMETGGTARAGQMVRLLDVPADAGAGMGLFEDLRGHGDPSAFAAALQTSAASAYGTAARAFIRKIQATGLDVIGKQWREYRSAKLEDFAGKGADGQTKRAAERFLLCILAGERAAEWGILPWPKGAATRAVWTCFRAWLEHRGGNGPAEDMAIRAQALRFLEQHGQSRFQDVALPDDKCVNRVGFRERFGDSIRYHVLPESFKSEVVKGYPAKHAAKVLKAAGILVTPDPERQMQWLTVPEGLGKIRGYILTVPDSE